MTRLKIVKSGIRVEKAIGEKRVLPAEYTNCEFEVPGVGRLRTGERHPDFHIDEIQGDMEPNKLKRPLSRAKAKTV